MSEAQKNWAGNLTYSAREWVRPRSVEEVQEVVRRAERVKALGSRHSFNRVADTPGTLVSLEHLSRVTTIDPVGQTATVEGGIRYGELAVALHEAGFALPNLASLPHISVAGAVATATHGSGVRNGCLSTSVSALEIVRADGERVRLSRRENPDTFPGAVVGLGKLGVVTSLTLDIEPTYDVRQWVFEGLPEEVLESNFDAVMGGATSVSLFTTWDSPTLREVWVKDRSLVDRTNQDWFGARPADGPRNPVPGAPPVNSTPQLGEVGPWHMRLPHFRLEFTPSSGQELQTEYFVSRTNAWEAYRAIRALGPRITPLLFVSEIRTVAADDLWLSPAYEEDVVAFHFTWHQDGAVYDLLPDLDAALLPFRARPHWGKISVTPEEELAERYPRLSDFQILARTFDPEGKFA